MLKWVLTKLDEMATVFAKSAGGLTGFFLVLWLFGALDDVLAFIAALTALLAGH